MISLRPWVSQRFLVAVAAVAVLFVLLVATSARLLITESSLRENIAEDMVWLSSQGQYEAVRTLDALSSYRNGEIGIDDVQLRFDLLVSRLVILEEGEPRRQIESLGFADRLDDYRALLDLVRPTLPTLAHDDVAGIEDLRKDILPMALLMRDIANAGLLARRDKAADLRDRRQQSLIEILATLVATMVAGLLVAVVLVRDHRNMVDAETALERERETSKLHRAFISIVSHQFRTPIAIIDSSAQRMIRRGASMGHEEIATRAEKIHSACLRLTRLMESTLNAARLEEGEIGFNPRACNLGELLDIFIGSQPEGDQARIQLDITGLPRWIEADTTLLEQAVQNLISNALKYSPNGAPVLVRARLAGDEILLGVSDRGVGIPAAELGSLFQRFFRASTSEGIPGTGIGLNFVAQIASLHGGRVDVESAVGEGSTFTLRLPYRRPDALAITKAAEAREALA